MEKEEQSLELLSKRDAQVSDERLAELEALLWGEEDSQDEGDELPVVVAEESSETGFDQPKPTLSEQLTFLQKEAGLQQSFFSGLLNFLPQSLSFLAACGPACVAHLHGIGALAGSAGGSGITGIGVPYFSSDHSHAGHAHTTGGKSDGAGHGIWDIFYSGSTGNALQSYSSGSGGSASEFLWLPVLVPNGNEKYVALDDLWKSEQSVIPVDDLVTSFLIAA